MWCAIISSNSSSAPTSAGARSIKLKVGVAGLSLLPPEARRPRLITSACLRALAATPPRKSIRPRGEVNIVLLSLKDMLALNRKYLSHDHDTDVIAFNYDLAPGQGPDQAFGDIFISATLARRQAREFGHGVLEETITLVIHGALHLIGYDDSTAGKKALMFRRQEDLLKELWLKTRPVRT